MICRGMDRVKVANGMMKRFGDKQLRAAVTTQLKGDGGGNTLTLVLWLFAGVPPIAPHLKPKGQENLGGIAHKGQLLGAWRIDLGVGRRAPFLPKALGWLAFWVFFIFNPLLGKFQVISLSVCSDSWVIDIEDRVCSSFIVKRETN